MLGLTAQWMGMTGIHANSVAPILVEQRAGTTKIHILQGTDAAGTVTLLHGQPETVMHKENPKG